MARKASRPQPASTEHLRPWFSHCTACGQPLWADYRNRRTVATLTGLIGLLLDVRRCHNRACDRYGKPYRPEAEGFYALPQHEFGLDVIALVGALRYAGHRSIPEIHQALRRRGLAIAERTVTNLLDRYDELLAVTLTDDTRLRGPLAEQGQVILAIDGLQPDVGHDASAAPASAGPAPPPLPGQRRARPAAWNHSSSRRRTQCSSSMARVP